MGSRCSPSLLPPVAQQPTPSREQFGQFANGVILGRAALGREVVVEIVVELDAVESGVLGQV